MAFYIQTGKGIGYTGKAAIPGMEMDALKTQSALKKGNVETEEIVTGFSNQAETDKATPISNEKVEAILPELQGQVTKLGGAKKFNEVITSNGITTSIGTLISDKPIADLKTNNVDLANAAF